MRLQAIFVAKFQIQYVETTRPNKTQEQHAAGRTLVRATAPPRGGQIEAEQPCANCEEVVARVKAFRNANADPNMKLRGHFPAHATNNEAFCWPIDLIAACA